jgi:hypothetical protein
MNQGFHNGSSRYFWWSALRLDSDPLNRHAADRIPMVCPDNTENCSPADPSWIWVDPGWMAKFFVFSAFPAFLLTKGIVRGLAGLGVSEIVSFFVAMPPLTLAWFYFVGWTFDRRRRNRART